MATSSPSSTSFFYYTKISVIPGRIQGLRGALYKLAFFCAASRIQSGNDAISYNEQIMVIRLCFETGEMRTYFQNAARKLIGVAYRGRQQPRVECGNTREAGIPSRLLAVVTGDELYSIHENSPVGSIDFDRSNAELDAALGEILR